MSARRAPSVEVLAALLVLLVSVAAWRTAVTRPGIDFYQFWLVGQSLLAGEVSDPYPLEAGARLGAIGQARAVADGDEYLRAAAAERSQVEVFATPFLYASFGAVATGDYERDYRRFQLASLLAGLLAIGLLCRVLGYGLVATGIAVALLGPSFEPYESETVVGNVNRLLLLALAGFLILGRDGRPGVRAGVGGVLLGVAIGFKPTIAVAVGVLGLGRLLRGQLARLAWEASGAAVGVLAAVGFSGWAFGSFGLWRAWLGALDHLMREFAIPLQAGNFSLVQLGLEATGHNLSVPVGIVVLVTLLGALLWRTFGSSRAEGPAGPRGAAIEDALLLGAGVTATLLFGRLAWHHYYLLTAPLLLCLARPRATRGGRVLGVLIATACAWFLISFQAFRLFDSSNPQLAAATVSAGAVLLFGVAVVELLAPQTEPPVSASQANARAAVAPGPPTSSEGTRA